MPDELYIHEETSQRWKRTIYFVKKTGHTLYEYLDRQEAEAFRDGYQMALADFKRGQEQESVENE